jgi:SNF2 family DNA or RNA helicase
VARVDVDDNVLVVWPRSPKEMPRVSSAVRPLHPKRGPDRSGKFSLMPEDAVELADRLPPTDHDWSARALAQLDAERGRRTRLDAIRPLVEAALQNQTHYVGDYPLLSKLDAHQVDVLAVLAVPGLEGIGLFDEQGTGKTISCVCGFDFLRRRGIVDQLLVIAPKSMVETWAATARTWIPNAEAKALSSAGAARRAADITAAKDILITNYETATRDAVLLAAWARRYGRRTLLVVDESFFVKNSETLRSKAVAVLRDACTLAIVACGTPAPNSAADIVNQIQIADRGHTFGKQMLDVEERAVIAAALRERAVYLRRLKHEVLDLPGRTVTRVSLDLAPQQHALYARLRDELLVELRNIDDQVFLRQYTSYLARRMALLQLCSHPGAIDPSYDEVPAKLSALDGLLSRLIDAGGEKVVVWSFFTYSLNSVFERYQKYCPVRIDGSVRAVDRSRAIDAFQTDPKVRLFIGNPAAAGAGITLTAARCAIYESFSNQAAHYLQSLDRIHRRGQERDVEYFILLGNSTVEITEYERLLRKEHGASELLGDDPAPIVTREQFITDLGASSVPPSPSTT